MYFIIRMLPLVCFLCTKAEIMLQDATNGEGYNSSSLAGADGSCYEKPIGKCYYSRIAGGVAGCHCSPPALVGYTTAGMFDIDFVVCTTPCGGNTCPKAPKGTGSCTKVFSRSMCVINCNDDEDCPEAAVCHNWGGATKSCMYRP
ncbi:hypothetical protein FOL47_008087 [Perkinsus chesapeaki]|uniref:Uncharacterized protein n=1 Tax=Perkinsus chesapeaki TaxID=330153 RepID=A0A7J6MUH1_PERCH|nr:hypothetical protein FOL47_008087 [Perkinsus chesapeaki]